MTRAAIRSVFRAFVLPIVLGAAVVLTAAGIYWLLEALLRGRADYDRGVYEGAAVVVTMNGGYAFARRVLSRVDAKKEERV